MGAQGARGTSALEGYARVAWRRRWLILAAIVIVPLAAALLSAVQAPRYQASSGVLVNSEGLVAFEGLRTGATPDPDRVVQTQVDLAHTAAVARPVLNVVHPKGMTVNDFLDSSSVSVNTTSDLITLSVDARTRGLATRLAGEYARQFVIYQQDLRARQIRQLQAQVAAEVDRLRGEGQQGSPVVKALVARQRELAAAAVPQTPAASVVDLPYQTQKVQPTPTRNVLIGLGLGVVLAAALALMAEALDPRVRSAAEAGERLGLPLLGRVPKPARVLRGRRGLVMLDDPDGAGAEVVRRTATSLEFTNVGGGRAASGTPAIMVTSAVRREGKSTVIANLAIALARAGYRVVVADLDLRRRSLAGLFGLDGRSGLTDVLLGQADLDEAVVSVSIETGGDEAVERRPRLDVIPAGTAVSNPADVIRSERLAELLEGLRRGADLVLVDSPPMLDVSDALVLSAHVDAAIVVARLGMVRRDQLDEVRQVLDASPVQPIAFVVTGGGASGRDYSAMEPVPTPGRAERGLGVPLIGSSPVE